MNMTVRFGTTTITGPKARLLDCFPKIEAVMQRDKSLAGVQWTYTHHTQGDQTSFTVHVPKSEEVAPGEIPESLMHEAHLVFLIHDVVTRVPKGAPKAQGRLDVTVTSDCLLASRIQSDFKAGPYKDVKYEDES